MFMAYEVTKRIKGHDYRYVVEGYRDPTTGKQRTRWRYVGVVSGGKVVPGSPRQKNEIGREKIIDETARLLEHRDPGSVTVAVIAKQVGASESTFYRYFPNRKSVLGAALSRICSVVIRDLPTLDVPIATRDEARRLFRDWCETMYRAMLQQRPLRWAISHGHRGALRARIERSLIKVDTTPLLTGFFEKIRDAGFATIEDPRALAASVRAIHTAVLQARVANPADDAFPSPEYAEIFPLIELAVFGPNSQTRQKGR